MNTYTDWLKFVEAQKSPSSDMPYEQAKLIERNLWQQAKLAHDIECTVFPLPRKGKQLLQFADGSPYRSVREDLRAAIKGTTP